MHSGWLYYRFYPLIEVIEQSPFLINQIESCLCFLSTSELITSAKYISLFGSIELFAVVKSKVSTAQSASV